MRPRRSYPRHAYPLLLAPPAPPGPAPLVAPARLSRKARAILASIERGARVLFDMEQGRALLYRFGRGIEHVGEMTVRMLARLVRQGLLVMAGREGRLVHYQRPAVGLAAA